MKQNFPTLSAIAILLFFGLCQPAKGQTTALQNQSLQVLVKSIAGQNDSNVQATLLKGMLIGLEGRGQIQTPAGWDELKPTLLNSENDSVRDRATQLSQIFGDQLAIHKSLRIVQDANAGTTERRNELRSLLSMRNQDVSLELESLLDERGLRMDAIRGYAIMENPAAPAILLNRYPEFELEYQRAILETLSSRKRYAAALLKEIKTGTVSREEIPIHVARSMQQNLGTRFDDVFGTMKPIADDREKTIKKYKKLLSSKSLSKADPSHGRAVFEKTCAACHQMYGSGGKVGPDLTGSNRANLDYILLNSVDPSYDVPDSYKMVTVLTYDGRLINGVVENENAAVLVLKTAEQPRVVISQQDIDERKVSDKSIMPEGQLDQLKPDEVIDLVKYLQTTQQVELKQ
ncbi:MAG: c-type cytochrome [Planctomycetota bacterium]